jgi:hypothetical protein
MIFRDGQLYIDHLDIRSANLSEANLYRLLTHGSTASRLIHEWILSRFENLTKGPYKGKNAPEYVVDDTGRRLHIRMLTKSSGVSTTPAAMRGVGRKYEHRHHRTFLKSVSGFIFADIESAPQLVFGSIPTGYIPTGADCHKLSYSDGLALLSICCQQKEIVQ